jgi:DedD protein
MNQSTKQRVVGTVVLLALALIFLPLVLDGDGNYQPTITSRIPETPVIDFMPEPAPERPVIDADRFQPQASVPSEAQAVPIAEPAVNPQDKQALGQSPSELELVDSEPSLDDLSLPEGWSVRLGIFSNSVNAANLTQRLLEAGYRAYSRQVPGAQGVVTGVFVGPHVDRAEANLLKDRLQDEFQLAGLVVRFEVDSI